MFVDRKAGSIFLQLSRFSINEIPFKHPNISNISPRNHLYPTLQQRTMEYLNVARKMYKNQVQTRVTQGQYLKLEEHKIGLEIHDKGSKFPD